jgi:hypothetical protein
LTNLPVSLETAGYVPGSERGYNILFGHVQRLAALF